MKTLSAKPGTKGMAKRKGSVVREAAVGYRASVQPFKLVKHIRALTTEYDFTESDLADILDVTKRTITRWKDRDDTLSEQQMDRIDVLESILNLGKRVLGSEEDVKLWLNSPVLSLDGRKPIEFIKTESGRRRVESVLLQIESGVF